MKTRMITFGILMNLFFAQMAMAQVEFGAKAGVQFNDMSIKGIGLLENFIPEPQMTPGLTASIYSSIPLGAHVQFVPSIGYARKGFKVQESMNVDLFGFDLPIGATATTRLDYLELPALLKFHTGAGNAKFYVTGGPYVAYAVHGDVKATLNSIIDIKLGTFPFNVEGALYNPWEFGVKGGAGVEVATGSGSFFAEAMYTQGLTDVLDEPVVDIRMKNFGVGVSVGYALHF